MPYSYNEAIFYPGCYRTRFMRRHRPAWRPVLPYMKFHHIGILTRNNAAWRCPE